MKVKELPQLKVNKNKNIGITIKKNKGITKFKVRTSKYLYTLKVDNKEKADRIMQAIPPSICNIILDLSKVVIEKKKVKKSA